MANRSSSKVVVLDKDRLTRFGFERIAYIAEWYDCEIELVDTNERNRKNLQKI